MNQPFIFTKFKKAINVLHLININELYISFISIENSMNNTMVEVRHDHYVVQLHCHTSRSLYPVWCEDPTPAVE